MGESTCLLRSYSTPSDTSSCEAPGGNPLCVLGESISFGRFMSESLDWEKWSAFSHNRYVEEAEKFSRPGSVAAKKAYFEAHYKRKAAEKAAALIQEANAQANGTFDSATQEGNCTDSSIEMKAKSESIVTANEQLDEDAVNYQVADYTDTSQYNCDVGQSDLDISNVQGAEDVTHPHIDTNPNVESCILVDNSSQLDHVEVYKEIAIPLEENMPETGTAGQEVLALPIKGREVNSSPKLSTKTRAAKLPYSLGEKKAGAAIPPRSGLNNGLKVKKSVRDSVKEKRLTARSPHMSINLPSGTGETSKTAAAAVKSRNGINSVSKIKKFVRDSVEERRLTARSLYMSVDLPSGSGKTSKAAAAPVKPRNETNRASKSMKPVGDSAEKKPTPRSLHMSINLSSGAGETSKTASVLEHIRIEKIHSHLPNISKDHPVASRTSTKASHGFLNHASANPPSQGRRTERLLNKSVSGGVTANAKLSSTSDDCLKSSSTTKSNPRSPTTSSPFRFRSEERAVKRKEASLQRMNEIKFKEEEKAQLQRTSKEKTEHDHKKLRQSSGFNPKLNEDRHGGGSRSPSNQIKKISLTLPRSQVGKKASSSAVQDKNTGNSWKPPISNNNTKRVTEKINRTTTQLVTSLTNITRENASPNIQQ